MSFLVRGGSLDLSIPAGQSIALGSLGAGTVAVQYQTQVGAAPLSYYQAATLVSSTTVLGPFANGQNVRLFASTACDLEYVVGTNPVLTSAGPAPFTTTLLNAVVAAGSGPTFVYPGGSSNFSVVGAMFNGATVVLQYDAGGGNFQTLPGGNSSFVATDGCFIPGLAAGTVLRATVFGTPGAAITATLGR